MRVLILTYGSRGDVQPYVALGRGLEAKGHEVTLATSKRFSAFVGEHGLRFAGLSDDLLAIIDTDQGREMLENTNNVLSMLRRMFAMAKQVGPMQRALLEDSWRVAKAARPDVVIFHPKAYGGPLVAEKLGVPVLLASMPRHGARRTASHRGSSTSCTTPRAATFRCCMQSAGT